MRPETTQKAWTQLASQERSPNGRRRSATVTVYSPAPSKPTVNLPPSAGHT
jgi:hypothetical protein